MDTQQALKKSELDTAQGYSHSVFPDGSCLLNLNKKKTFWTEDPGKSLIAEGCWGDIAEFAGLSPRETEVSRLIFEGSTRDGVAAALGLSTRTIRHYMEMLHNKLRVSSRIGLVLRLIQIRDTLAENNRNLTASQAKL